MTVCLQQLFQGSCNIARGHLLQSPPGQKQRRAIRMHEAGICSMLLLLQAHTPSAEDHARRQVVVQQVSDTVRLGLEGTSNLHISTYGSFLSGLYSPSGDLDLSIDG